MRTKIFAHKGILGIQSNSKVSGIVEKKPIMMGLQGFTWLIDMKFVDIQPSALKILKKMAPGSEKHYSVNIFKHSSGKTVLSWHGASKELIIPQHAKLSDNWDPSKIKAKSTVRAPKDFVSFVNKNLTQLLEDKVIEPSKNETGHSGGCDACPKKDTCDKKGFVKMFAGIMGGGAPQNPVPKSDPLIDLLSMLTLVSRPGRVTPNIAQIEHKPTPV
jgi:hypothetical protein